MGSSKMDRVFQRSAERLNESTHRDAAQQSMAGVAAALKLSCFAYLALRREPGSAPNLISTYPPPGPPSICSAATNPSIRWYVGQYASLSPSEGGLDLKCEMARSLKRALFKEAEKFGIRCGFTFPIHDDKGGNRRGELCN